MITTIALIGSLVMVAVSIVLWIDILLIDSRKPSIADRLQARKARRNAEPLPVPHPADCHCNDNDW